MHPVGTNILICEDDEAVAREAAARFACAAFASVAQRGRFCVAVPGGWSPRGMFAALSTPRFADLIEWSATHVFFTDERCVPPDHQDSNYKLADEMLLSKVPIPNDNVHRFYAELSPQEAAKRYEDELTNVMGNRPRLDLIVLGMGKDSHTASLFPHSAALAETDSLAAVNYVKKLDAYRLTLTIPVLRDARSIVVLVMGYEKSEVLREVLRGEPDPIRHPAQAARPVDGELLWLVDRDAASKL